MAIAADSSQIGWPPASLQRRRRASPPPPLPPLPPLIQSSPLPTPQPSTLPMPQLPLPSPPQQETMMMMQESRRIKRLSFLAPRRYLLARGDVTTSRTRGTRGAVGNESSSSRSYATINKKEMGRRCARCLTGRWRRDTSNITQSTHLVQTPTHMTTQKQPSTTAVLPQTEMAVSKGGTLTLGSKRPLISAHDSVPPASQAATSTSQGRGLTPATISEPSTAQSLDEIKFPSRLNLRESGLC